MMNKIQDIALEYFVLPGEERPCRCEGAHEICLRCKICRADSHSMIVSKIDNLALYIDHTILKPETTSENIKKLCEEAKRFGFKAVCVNPIFVNLCKKLLDGTNTLVCSVAGFPLGANLSETKANEAQYALREGSREIDMVNNITSLKEKDIPYLLHDIGLVADACLIKNSALKVIIETCLLTEEEKIIASLAAKKAGALFVKTSTGFSSAGATVTDVSLMRQVVGPKFGVKASGGVKSTDAAIEMLKAGANRIGTSSGVSIVEGYNK